MPAMFQLDLGEDAQKAQEKFENFYQMGIMSGAADIGIQTAQHVAEKTKAEIDAVIQMVEESIQGVLEDGVDALYKAIGLNEELIEQARTVIKIANSGLSFASSYILKGISLINSFDVNAIPMSALAAGMQIIKSFASIYYQMYIKVYWELIQLFIYAYNNPDVILDLAWELVKQALDQIYDMLDEQCKKYLGMSIAQLRYYIRKGWNLYKQWQKARKERREKKKQQEKMEGVNDSGSKISVSVSFELDEQALKDQLDDWLLAQRDAIYNAFAVAQILDAVEQLKGLFKTLTNASIESLADGLNSVEDIVELLEELGLGDEDTSIDLSLIPSLNINDIYASLNSLKDSFNVESVMNDALTNIGSAALESTRVNGSVSKKDTYDIKTDAETKTITIQIYSTPTTSLKKKIYNAFSKAKDADKNALFSQSDLKILTDTLNEMTNSGETSSEIQYKKYKVVIEISATDEEDGNLATDDTVGAGEAVVAEQPGNTKDDSLKLGNISEEWFTPSEAGVKDAQEKKRDTIAILHMAFSILKSVFGPMKELCTLINNYKINKAYARSNSYAQLAELYQECMAKLGLDKSKKRSEKDPETGEQRYTAMYTVRSVQLYEYMQSIGIIPSRGTQSATYNATKEQMTDVSEWIVNNSPDDVMPELADEYIIYVDYASIANEKKCIEAYIREIGSLVDPDLAAESARKRCRKQNGTMTGIDNVDIMEDRIIWSDSLLPRLPSQILQAYSRKEMP